MKFYVGKALELVGIVFTAYGLWTGIVMRSERLEIVFVGAGTGIFFLGWLLERRVRG